MNKLKKSMVYEIKFLKVEFFIRFLNRGTPKIVTIMNSDSIIWAVTTINETGSGDINTISKPIKTLNTAGIRDAIHIFFIFDIAVRAKKDARVPTTTSIIPRDDKRFEIAQPTVKPNIYSGLKNAKRVITSDILNWIGP